MIKIRKWVFCVLLFMAIKFLRLKIYMMLRDYFKYVTGNLEQKCARNQICVPRKYKDAHENLNGNDSGLQIWRDPKIWLQRPNCIPRQEGRQAGEEEIRKKEGKKERRDKQLCNSGWFSVHPTPPPPWSLQRDLTQFGGFKYHKQQMEHRMLTDSILPTSRSVSNR